ncbi:hypothetical protein SRABI128_04692 [Microbacterium sp. Bi128]|nr:hypothetical protein SRABI128_04692 [Microbacterium sp. Bi128]
MDEVQHRGYEVPLLLVVAEAADQASVDLDHVHRQLAQVADGGIAGPEVIDLELHAEPAKAVERILVDVAAVDRHRLGQFHDQV